MSTVRNSSISISLELNQWRTLKEWRTKINMHWSYLWFLIKTTRMNAWNHKRNRYRKQFLGKSSAWKGAGRWLDCYLLTNFIPNLWFCLVNKQLSISVQITTRDILLCFWVWLSTHPSFSLFGRRKRRVQACAQTAASE